MVGSEIGTKSMGEEKTTVWPLSQSENPMSKLRYSTSMSPDGFVAGEPKAVPQEGHRATTTPALLGDPAAVSDHGEAVGDYQDADTPGKGDPDIGAEVVLARRSPPHQARSQASGSGSGRAAPLG